MNEHIPTVGKLFFAALKRLQSGTATIVTPEGERHTFQGAEPGPSATFILHDWGVLSRVMMRGDIGFAEDYMEGNWETDDLPALLTLATANSDHLEKFLTGHWWYRLTIAIKHFLRRNSKAGSKKNIRAHYDLGNDFYSLWLDKSMTYSSALFDGQKDRSLEEAQKAKYARILDKLDPKPGDHILEIGCGWGGFAEMAAQRGCKVTGITLSREQQAFARERMAKNGHDHAVAIEYIDYRDLKDQYDHIVSIEMFEAVGMQYWPSYFNTLKKALKPGGKAVIQTITIEDHLFKQYISRSDFIQQYIFPGGMLPSISRFAQEAQTAGLRFKEKFDFGKDYAKTLSHWLESFENAIPKIREMGYTETFLRMWRFYLSCCIAEFTNSRTNVTQVELVHA